MKKSGFKKSLLSFFILYSLFANSSQFVLAQDSETTTPSPSPTATPESEEMRKLKEQIELLKLEKEKTDLEKSINDSKFPKPTSTPLAGDTTLEGVKIESEMLAYRALANAADNVVKDIKESGGVDGFSKVAIFDEVTVKNLFSYSVTIQQLNIMRNQYDSILQPTNFRRNLLNNNKFIGILPGVAGALAAGQSVLGGFVDLMAFLRTDTKITGAQFTIEESAFASEVFRALKKEGVTDNLFYPAQYSPKVSGVQEYVILSKIEDLYATKTEVEKLVTLIENLEKAYQEQKTEKDTLAGRKKQIAKELKVYAVELKKLEDLNNKFPNSDNWEKVLNKRAQIAAAEKERDEEIPKQLAKNALATAAIQKRLIELYKHLRISVSLPDLIEATTEYLKKLNETSEIFLGREFTYEEMNFLLSDDEDKEKESLVKSASDFLKRPLTPAEKQNYLHPLSDSLRALYLRIVETAGDKNPDEDFLKNLDYYALFNDEELLTLIYKEDPLVKALLDTQSKNKSATVSRLKALNAQFDKFFTEITKVDSATGINPITSYVKAENLKNALGCKIEEDECPGTFFLSLKVISAGGNNRTKKNLITNVFTGADITHSGGAIVEYKLYDADGVVKYANTFTSYEYYRKPKTVTKMTDENYSSSKKDELKKREQELKKREEELKKREEEERKRKEKSNNSNSNTGN